MIRSGIVGHRSWIARAISQRIEDMFFGHELVPIPKDSDRLRDDLSEFDSVYLVAGRARPTQAQREDEVALVRAVMDNPRPPGRLVYVSSLAVERGEGDPYSEMKLSCERLVLERDWGFVIRPPVIFGPEQSPYADMLLPAIARSHFGLEPLVIREPTRPFHIMSVGDVALAATKVGEGRIQTQVLSLYSVDTITPIQLIDVVSPGLPFYVPDGWHDGWPEPAQSMRTGNASSFSWYWSKADLRSALRGMVNSIINQYTEASGHGPYDLPARVVELLSE